MFKFLILFVELFVTISLAKSNVENLTIPNGFLIGTASSAYQIEGAWNFRGKININVFMFFFNMHFSIN